MDEATVILKITRICAVATVFCILGFAGCVSYQSYSWNSANSAMGRACMDGGGRWMPIQAAASTQQLGNGCVKP